jgi:transitional endoplasmic reticulum ATPase
MPAATATKTKDPAAENEKAILATLARLGGKSVKDDDLIFEGSKFILPGHFGGNVGAAIKFLMDWQQRQDEMFAFSREFAYRPMDGAAAFERAMKRVFGTSGIGKAQYTMFGKKPPQMISVATGPKTQLQVPWGQIEFSPLAATFILGSQRNDEQGYIFSIAVQAPLRYRAQVEGFFKIVEEELRERSIYRGKAFMGAEDPSFLDTDKIDPSVVVYSGDVQTQLSVNMWSLLRHSDAMRRNGIPLKRAVLVEGPYGTGKTLAGRLTAKEAVENGWTFILARPGKDDLTEVLKMAQLYSPAVVWYEDIDVIAKGESDTQISQLLDALDGITAKGTEILAGFTTNFADKIQKGVLRPGRLDAVIHIGPLDDAGIEKLCRVTIPVERQGDINYTEVAQQFDSETWRLPSFVGECVKRAMSYSIARNSGELGVIDTEDLVHAAIGLGDQVALMDRANEGVKVPELNKALGSAVAAGLNGAKFYDRDEDDIITLRTNGYAPANA